MMMSSNRPTNLSDRDGPRGTPFANLLTWQWRFVGLATTGKELVWKKNV